MSIELKDPDSQLNSLVDPEQEQMLLRMKLSKDLSEPETVEVVSPLVLGDGSVSYIQSYETTTTEVRPIKFRLADNNNSSGSGNRLSLNDKMKNVLVELLENEKVKLNRSLSMTDSDLEGPAVDDDDEDDDDFVDSDEHDQRNNNSSSYKTTNTVFIVREKLINDYYDYESEQCQVFENPNASFDIETTTTETTSSTTTSFKDQENNNSEEDLLLKQKIINELNVSGAQNKDNDDNEEEDDDKDDARLEGESQSEESSVPTTPLAKTPTGTTPSHIPVHAATNKKKNKKKNRRK